MEAPTTRSAKERYDSTSKISGTALIVVSLVLSPRRDRPL